MHRQLVLALVPALALAACGEPEEAATVEEQYEERAAAIENRAAEIEAEADEATLAAEAALEEQGNLMRQRAEAAEQADDGQSEDAQPAQ